MTGMLPYTMTIGGRLSGKEGVMYIIYVMCKVKFKALLCTDTCLINVLACCPSIYLRYLPNRHTLY